LGRWVRDPWVVGALLAACSSPPASSAEQDHTKIEAGVRGTDAGRRDGSIAPHEGDEAGLGERRDGAEAPVEDEPPDGTVPADALQPGRAGDGGAPGATRARSALLWPERWVRIAPAEDPFDDRPPVVSCSATAVMAETLAEENVYSVDTGACNYLTAMQPTVRAIAAGELLKVRLWHFELTADEPAEAHAALVIDGITLLDERVPIPSAGGLIVRELRAERDVAAGARAYFHLHNHGENSWSLVEVSGGSGAP
jgi:hypothetical protein